MKRIITSLLILVLTAGFIYSAPRPKIINQSVTPYMQRTNPAFTADSCVTTGLNAVAKNTYVYFSVINIGDTASIQNTNWTLQTKPSGSNAAIMTVPSLGWVKIRVDLTGTYEIKASITTATGSKDTVLAIYSSNYVGTGNFDGVPAVFPNCMSCHGGFPAFQTIFNKWKDGAHANTFKQKITSGPTSFGTSCFKCHTTGSDKNLKVNNSGFDDKAAQLGWVWSNYSPPKAGNWDTLKNNFPSLVSLAGIGCESCHGAGSEHASSGVPMKIDVTTKSDACASCHDNPWRYPIVNQWRNSIHSDPVFEGRRIAAPQRNTLADCNRCHSGKNFVDYSYSRVDSVPLVQGDLVSIGCPQCHDPHGSPNTASLRSLPSDTLANGYSYASAGTGKVCMSCHQSRQNNRVLIVAGGSFSAYWGPHESPQGDVLTGQNIATFGFPFISGSHKNIAGACVGCHMAPTTDTGTVQRDKVGGHSFNLHDPSSNFDLMSGCVGCHPGKNSFEDFVAPQDFDGDGIVEPWQTEVDGCIRNLRIALPPAGLDSVDWKIIARDSSNTNLRKAYWNYQLIKNDGSRGMHNPFLAVQVLLTSKNYAVGVQQIGSEIPVKYELSQNYPNPFNPSTKIDFSLPRMERVTIKIFDITGREIVTLLNENKQPGKYSTTWFGLDNNNIPVSSGVYFYQMQAGSNIFTKRMVLIK